MDRWKIVSPHFTKEEICSPQIIRSGAYHLVREELLVKANEVRRLANRYCYINHRGLYYRGVVSPREAIEVRKKMGGAELTTHAYGIAVDMSCYDIPVKELYDMFLLVGFTWVKQYEWGVHGDIRETY